MLIAGNWKMNKTRPEAVSLAETIVAGFSRSAGVEVAVCPTSVCLDAVGAVLAGSGIRLGAQNMHREESGAFTGEVSAGMLRSVGCRYVILGHSERRQYFGETDADVNGKTHAAVAHGMVPIVCVGEHLKEREDGHAEVVVRGQLEGALAGVSVQDGSGLVVAYEPVWAIGTGVTASVDQAQSMHAFIRTLLVKHYSEVGKGIDILYGGSMKPDNAAELLRQPDVNGGLIGGASLKADQFLAIVDAARRMAS
jgi:triosephosphate isomerase